MRVVIATAGEVSHALKSISRGAGHNRPQNPVGGAPRKAAGAGPSPRRGTLERADQTSR
jgi:hypothetical protein